MWLAIHGAMTKSTSALETPLGNQLDRLAAFEPVEAPVLSLYLDMRPDQHGRDDRYATFLRKCFPLRAATFDGEARKSFDADVQRINEYLERQVRASANGLAIFACSAADSFFEAVQLNVPIDNHWLFVSSVPHLYPLARVNDQYPRYAALLVNTNVARVFVFGLGLTETERQVTNTKTRRTTMGGWSQARYQRHIDNFHLHHMKEVIDVLDRVVRDESITQIVVGCDDTTRPTLFEQLPQHLREKIVDTVHLGIDTPGHEVLSETMAVLRQKDAETDADQVQRMLDAWRADGLAVAGPEDTARALEMAQVEELLVTATPDAFKRAQPMAGAAPGGIDVDTNATGTHDAGRWKFADDLITRAQQTSARIRFIEDTSLLAQVGGVGALLRFKI
jgi:peptide chain release factor subunit 1